jgi:hypothetical protein
MPFTRKQITNWCASFKMGTGVYARNQREDLTWCVETSLPFWASAVARRKSYALAAQKTCRNESSELCLEWNPGIRPAYLVMW